MKTVDNFYLTKVIGGGAYGTVYLCRIKSKDNIEKETRARLRPNRKVACKMIKQKNVKARIKKYLIQEIEIMMRIKHENILRFLEAKKTTNNIYIFFEFCNGGDLRRFLEARGGSLDEKVTKVIVKQIAAGLKHLDENHAMHRDLKLDNILLNFPEFKGEGICPESYLKDFDPDTETLEVVIGDLGFARSIEPTTLAESYWGTPLNMAPEIMMGEQYDNKVDIWSFGTMMYELLVGFTPFTGMDPNDLAVNVNQGNYGIPKSIKLSLQCLDLLHKCLQYDVNKRINHENLLKHLFFEEDNDSEKISLSWSQGPGQNSFFEAPKNVQELNPKNAVMFNVKDSCLFNQTYQNALKKFQEKQNKMEQEMEPQKEPEEIKEVDKDLEDAGSEDDISDYKSILEESKHYYEKDEEDSKEAIVMDSNKQIEVMKSKKVDTPPKESAKEEKLIEETSQPNLPNLVEMLDEEPVTEELVANEDNQDEKGSEEEKHHKQLEEQDNESDDDNQEFEEDHLDFTVIDFNKELLRAKKLNAIPEVEEPELEVSVSKDSPIKLQKPAEPPIIIVDEEDDDEEGFEIVHFHDVTMIDSSYLLGTSAS